ncbi:MAG: S41 family peptidase [Holdemania massiliensis]
MECERYLKMMSEQGLQHLILDLRDNGGGYLDALVSVSSLFRGRYADHDAGIYMAGA